VQLTPDGLHAPSGLTLSGQTPFTGSPVLTASHRPPRHSNPLPPRGQSALVVHEATHTFAPVSHTSAAQEALAPRVVQSAGTTHGFVQAPHRQTSEPQSLSVRHWSSQWVLLSVPPDTLVEAQDGTAPSPRTPVTNAHIILAEIMAIPRFSTVTHSSELSSA
jgi:hypothetical protein